MNFVQIFAFLLATKKLINIWFKLNFPVICNKETVVMATVKMAMIEQKPKFHDEEIRRCQVIDDLFFTLV